MLVDFLDLLRPSLENEEEDFRKIVDVLSSKTSANFMPSVTFDLWPVFSLHCTEDGHKITDQPENVYIVPIGEADFFFKSELEKIVSDFYNDDVCDLPHMYGGELEEMILLSNNLCDKSLDIKAVSHPVNVVYMQISMPGASTVHMLFVLTTSVTAWQDIFEKFDIECEMLCDSNKGLGDWLENTALWEMLQKTEKRTLLPKFYFKGKYISNAPPKTFEFICSIAESRRNECLSEVYKTNF